MTISRKHLIKWRTIVCHLVKKSPSLVEYFYFIRLSASFFTLSSWFFIIIEIQLPLKYLSLSHLTINWFSHYLYIVYLQSYFIIYFIIFSYLFIYNIFTISRYILIIAKSYTFWYNLTISIKSYFNYYYYRYHQLSLRNIVIKQI